MRDNNLRKRMGKISAVALAVVMMFSTVAMATTTSKTIGVSEAKSIARKEVPKATIKYMVLGKDDGQAVYKGKLIKGKYLYEIEIDAITGEVYESDSDYIGSTTTASKINSFISINDVKNKALNRVSKLNFIYVRLCKDDGRYVYEGEAVKGNYEYSFEVNAYSGKIIEWERDYLK